MALIPFLVSGVARFRWPFRCCRRRFGLKTLATNDYKGVAYARKFPDAKKVYESASPFGFLEAYSSSYLHFAPGLSDNAGFNLPTMPANAYLGLYIDGDGPIGIMRDLTDKETAYFHYLPMVYPYVIKSDPKTFIVQFGGGISTEVALHSGAKDVTVAEGNRAVLQAFHADVIRKFTGDILSKVHVIDYEGRHFLAHTNERFDVIDLSLADSVGLSNPGGFAIMEKFSYTKEAMETYMRALAPGGVLSVTLWNKEEPPKSVLKLYATMAAAAREVDPAHLANSFFVASSYLSTATVLYKNGGFTPEEIEKLRAHTRAMSFDEIYSPGLFYDPSQTDSTLAGYVEQIFAGAAGGPPAAQPAGSTGTGADADADADPGKGDDTPPSGKADDGVLPATVMGRLAWHALISGQWPEIADRYVFNTRALTNDAPYFAAYVKTADLPRVLDRLELLQDEWGYLLIWATLGVACLTATVLLAIPLIWGWRAVFSRSPRQGADRALLRLSRRRLYHGRGRAHRPFRHGAWKSDHLGLGADHRHAGVLGSRRADLGTRLASHADGHADSIRRGWGHVDSVRIVSRPRARLDRRDRLSGPPRHLLPFDSPARLLDGLPDADRDDDARTSRQRSHVRLGMGRQRLLFGDRGRGGARHRDQFRPCSGDRGCRPGLSVGDSGLLRGHRFGPRTWARRKPSAGLIQSPRARVFRRAGDANLTLRRHITILQRINDAEGCRQSLTKNS